MTFDAGSIDADLTLDRSAFTRALREARAQGTAMEADGIEIPLSVEVEKALAKVEAMERELERATIELDAVVDLDTGDALADAEAFQRAAEAILGDIPLQIDIDTARAEAELLAWHEFNKAIMAQWRADAALAAAEVTAELGAVPDKHVQLEIDWDLNQAEALGQLELFNAEAEAVLRDVHMDIDVDNAAAMAKIAETAAAAEALDGKTINVDAKEGGGFGKLSGSVTRMEALITGLLLLAPLVPAVIAPAAAVAGGLASSITAIAGGVGVLGLGVGGAVAGMIKAQAEIKKQTDKLATLKEGTKEYAEQQKIVNGLQDDFANNFGEASAALDGMKDAWAGFQDATRPASLGLITQFLDLVSGLLPRLTPIFDAFAGVASNAFDSIAAFMDGPESQRMLDFFETIGAQSFDAILRVFGNLALLFGRLFEALGPEGVDILNALADSIGGLADKVDGLGDKQGFKDFIDYANENGPKVMDLLGAMFDAFIALGEALAPLAGPALAFFTGLFNAIADMPTELLTTLIVLFGGLFIAVQIFTAIGSAITATIAAWGVATTIFGALTTVVGFLASALTALWGVLLANPIILIIVAIIAIVAAVIYAYKHFETFRNIVDGVVHAIVASVQWFWNMLVTNFTEFGHNVASIWTAFWHGVIAVGRAIIGLIVGAVVGLWHMLVSNFTEFGHTVAGIWNTFWHGLVSAARDIAGNLIGFVGGLPGRILHALGNLGHLLYNAGRAVIQGLINGIRDMFRPLGDAMGAVGGFIADHLPGSPAKLGPLSQHGGYHMVYAGAELIRQLNRGINSEDVEGPTVANKGRALAGSISARLGGRDRLAPAGRPGGDINVTVVSPSRLRTDESLDVGLKHVAVANGWM